MSETILTATIKPSQTAMQYDWLNAALSFVLVVGAPVAFWLMVFEVLAPAMGFGYGMPERVMLGGGLGALLTMIWSIVWSTRDMND